jgi:hypothetical protein
MLILLTIYLNKLTAQASIRIDSLTNCIRLYIFFFYVNYLPITCEVLIVAYSWVCVWLLYNPFLVAAAIKEAECVILRVTCQIRALESNQRLDKLIPIAQELGITSIWTKFGCIGHCKKF